MRDRASARCCGLRSARLVDRLRVGVVLGRWQARSRRPGRTPRNSALASACHQPPWRMSVRADNDAFNFWRGSPTGRTRSTRTAIEVTVRVRPRHRGGASGSRSAARRARARAVRCAVPNDVALHRPGHVHAEAEPRAARGSRLAQTIARTPPGCMRAARRAWSVSGRCETVALHLGVTGPPAFGEFAQRTAHKLTGVYSRDPDRLGHADRLRAGHHADRRATRAGSRAHGSRAARSWTSSRTLARRSATFSPRRETGVPSCASVSTCRTRGGRASGARARRSSCTCWAVYAGKPSRATSRSTATR